jgi:type VI secretion system protein ImpL
MAAIWYSSYLGNKQLIADFNAAIGTYRQQVASTGLTLNPVQDARLDLILPPLQTLRTMPAGYEQSRAGTPWSLRFGLYQGNKLGSDAEAAYRRALNGLLLPRLIYILENQLNSNSDNAEFVYARLKVYLMLGVQGPLDRALVEGWMVSLLNEAFPGAALESTRNQYMAHLAALLEAPLTPIALDGNLVQRAQATLAKLPMADRAYTLIQHDPEVLSLPPWRVVDHIGPAGGRVLERKSGADLTEGVPGFYTFEGFHKVFVAKLADITNEITKDSWVLGPNAQTTGKAGAARLAVDVMALYLNDYVDKWVRLVGDVRIRPETDLRKLAEMLNILSGPNSPLKNLYLDIARETKLTVDEKAAQGVDPSQIQQTLESVGKQELGYRLSGKGVMGRVLNQLFLQGGGSVADLGADMPDAPEKRVEQRFDWLHQYVAGSPSPLDGMLQQLNQVYLQLNGINTALDQGGAALSDVTGGGAALDSLRSLASQVPGPLGEMLSGVAGGAGGAIIQRSAKELNDRWQADGARLCSTLLRNSYPIDPNSGTDATLDDFARVFAPGQLMDGFFKSTLANVVDTSRVPWRAQGDIPLSSGALEQFRLARQIGEALFRGGSTPSSSFEITPVSLDNGATQVLFELDGQVVSYNHGPQVPVQMQWPGTGVKQVRLSFQPQGGNDIALRGPWALFRLIDQGHIAKLGATHFEVTFNVGNHSVTYDIQAGSTLNPFSLKELHQFRCPGSLLAKQ